MPNLKRNFLIGRMNKSFDERLVPDGEVIDALNCRFGSTEQSEVGVVENAKGNELICEFTFQETSLSVQAKTIGRFTDSRRETIYLLIHDPNFVASPTGKLDMVVSYNVQTDTKRYHIISSQNPNDTDNTTLNFDARYLVTGIGMIEDLLFWTDDRNPPRFININRAYPAPTVFVDGDFSESIMVIKRPPIYAPTFSMETLPGQENFMRERFICFAYRYKYADGEYSATSPFSAPAFVSSPFDFSVDSFLNEGMSNLHNAARISYNTGGPLVVGIDLLFKEMDSNIIKVIEKIDKRANGVIDNTTASYLFSNSKIFTILPDSEILRLYDNVPRLAKAQTFMGNRLMYMNYLEGYDMVDSAGSPVNLDYYVELESSDIDVYDVTDSTSSGVDYTIDGTVSANNSQLDIDFANAVPGLLPGATISIRMTVRHGQSSGSVTPTSVTQDVDIDFTYTLQSPYTSVFDFASSVEFQEAIGTATNIQTVANACTGSKLTDIVNCTFPFSLLYASGNLDKVSSGIAASGEPVQIVTSPGSTVIGLKLPAMRYESLSTPADYAYEYLEIIAANIEFIGSSGSESLHSNRGYEVGIVYLDEFGRSSTALVSESNNVHVACELSSSVNQIKVIVPPSQVAPEWATNYKFVIKSDREFYETIYSNIFFIDELTNYGYLLLEGENARKVEVGDRLILKADGSGVKSNCEFITVLEKESQPSDFITGVPSPAGVYIKVRANNIDLTTEENDFISPGTLTGTDCDGSAKVSYPIGRIFDGTNYVDYDLPSGSRITIKILVERKEGSNLSGCDKVKYFIERDFIVSSDYDNFFDWWNGDNVDQALENPDIWVSPDANPQISYNSAISAGGISTMGNTTRSQIKVQFLNPGGAGQQVFLGVVGTKACGGGCRRKSKVEVNINVFRASRTVVLETEPSDTLPDIFFENHKVYAIQNGLHLGDTQNQSATQPAICYPEFSNCFCFGNGVESYKIRDSVVGRRMTLGNRVTSVSAQDYKASRRYSDITYSGIYNNESNVNKLNEFNLGLINYKRLEESFGPGYFLDGRQTDVLVLQEDKISYVLAGKNLLSDATGGSAITSVPEVLGTQVARIEEYGISYHPESFAKFGAYKFFTDAKRGAVIMLYGSGQSEQILVASDQLMGSWFRDVFRGSLFNQKQGGYDPYMGEYVLSMNDRTVATEDECVDCGVTQSIRMTSSLNQNDFCVDLGLTIGTVTVSLNVLSISSGSLTVSVDYDGSSVASLTRSATGAVSTTFSKSTQSPSTAQVSVSYSGSGSLDSVVFELEISCPVGTQLEIVEVLLSNSYDAGDSIHAEYYNSSGGFLSPLTSEPVTMVVGAFSPGVSRYVSKTGIQGSGPFPVNGSTVRIQTTKKAGDTYDYVPVSNSILYLRSSTNYANTSAGISSLIAAATQVLPITQSGNSYYGEFTMPNTGSKLYLIWDLRNSVPAELCYSETSKELACCDCYCDELCKSYELDFSVAGSFNYVDCDTASVLTMSVGTGVTAVCSRQIPVILTGTATVTETDCGCTPP